MISVAENMKQISDNSNIVARENARKYAIGMYYDVLKEITDHSVHGLYCCYYRTDKIDFSNVNKRFVCEELIKMLKNDGFEVNYIDEYYEPITIIWDFAGKETR